MTSDEYSLIYQVANIWSHYNPYNMLIYLQPLDKVQEDGVRDSSLKFRDEMVESFNRVLEYCLCRVVEVTTKEKKARCETVYNIIKDVFDL